MTASLITIVITVLLGSCSSLLVYRTILANETVLWIICAFTIVGVFALYLLAYLYRPIAYTVDFKGLTIQRPVKDVLVPISEIKDAYLVQKASMTSRERFGGNGGLFGFYGNFKTAFGITTWYATKLASYIMIETVSNDRILITPDDTSIVKEIRRVIGK